MLSGSVLSNAVQNTSGEGLEARTFRIVMVEVQITEFKPHVTDCMAEICVLVFTREKTETPND